MEMRSCSEGEGIGGEGERASRAGWGGRGFEYRQQLGQFFTPPEVVGFVWRILQIYYGDTFSENVKTIDPACGEGIFLVRALEEGFARANRLFGLDIDPKVEAQWEQLGIRTGVHLNVGDGLADHPKVGIIGGAFDLVVGNPPYGGKGAGGLRKPGRAESKRLEILFAERFLQLARPGGHVAIVLPEGIFANARNRPFRNWLVEQGRVLAVVSLPRWVFTSMGTTAKTSILFVRKRTDDETTEELKAHWTLLASVEEAENKEELERQLSTILGMAKDAESGSRPGIRILRKANPMMRVKQQGTLAERMSSGYWDPKWGAHRCFTRYPLKLLGEYITHITYGPIVTGKRPMGLKDPSKGVVLIGQKQFTDIGLDLTEATIVEENSDWDDPRARVRQWDLLFPRSGVGSLGKGRMGVFPYTASEVRCVVGCFVDIIRVQDIRSTYLFTYLKSHFGQLQIARFLSGVGTININFDQIRSLEIHVLPDEHQEAIDVQWRRMNEVYERALEIKRGLLNDRGHRVNYEKRIAVAKGMLNDLVRQVEKIIEGTRTEVEPVDRVLVKAR